MSAENQETNHQDSIDLLEPERPYARFWLTLEELERSLAAIAEEMAGYPT
jgi:hypothetical protein